MCFMTVDCGNDLSNVFTENVFLFQMQNGWLYVSRSEFFYSISQISVAADSINSRVVMIHDSIKYQTLDDDKLCVLNILHISIKNA